MLLLDKQGVRSATSEAASLLISGGIGAQHWRVHGDGVLGSHLEVWPGKTQDPWGRGGSQEGYGRGIATGRAGNESGAGIRAVKGLFVGQGGTGG